MEDQAKYKTKQMRHVVKAWERMDLKNNGAKEPKFFIEIDNARDQHGVPPIVKFTIQSDPIDEVGINGCQASDMLEYVKCLFESLNEAYPCRENEETILKLIEAIHWQEARVKNRIARQVEGKKAL